MSHDLSAENLLRLADEGDGDTLAALVDKALGSSARDTSASAAAAARAAALNFLAQDGRGTHGIEAVGAGRGFGGSDGAMGSGGAVSAGRGGLGLALGRRKFAAKPTKAAILRATLLEARSGDGSNIVHLAVGQKLGGATSHGWLGCLAAVLRAVWQVDIDPQPGVPRTATLLDGRTQFGWPPLHCLLRLGGQRSDGRLVSVADHTSTVGILSAAAALLVHGADARGEDNAGLSAATVARRFADGAARAASGGVPGASSQQRAEMVVLASLLDRASVVGGPAAVREALLHSPRTLTSAAGWAVVADLPAMAAALAWAEEQRRARAGGVAGTAPSATSGPARPTLALSPASSNAVPPAPSPVPVAAALFEAVERGMAGALAVAVARVGDAESQRLAVLKARDPRSGAHDGRSTLLHVITARKAGGPGPNGWPGALAVVLKAVCSVDTAAEAAAGASFVNARDWQWSTTLHYLVGASVSAGANASDSREGDRAAVLPCVAALLAAGADARATTKLGLTARWYAEYNGLSDAQRLLAQAERVGGTAAVAELLADAGGGGGPIAFLRRKRLRGRDLTDCEAWPIVSELPCITSLLPGAEDTPYRDFSAAAADVDAHLARPATRSAAAAAPVLTQPPSTTAGARSGTRGRPAPRWRRATTRPVRTQLREAPPSAVASPTDRMAPRRPSRRAEAPATKHDGGGGGGLAAVMGTVVAAEPAAVVDERPLPDAMAAKSSPIATPKASSEADAVDADKRVVGEDDGEAEGKGDESGDGNPGLFHDGSAAGGDIWEAAKRGASTIAPAAVGGAGGAPTVDAALQAATSNAQAARAGYNDVEEEIAAALRAAAREKLAPLQVPPPAPPSPIRDSPAATASPMESAVPSRASGSRAGLAGASETLHRAAAASAARRLAEEGDSRDTVYVGGSMRDRSDREVLLSRRVAELERQVVRLRTAIRDREESLADARSRLELSETRADGLAAVMDHLREELAATRS